MNIWTNGPNPGLAALARARDLGFKDPRIVRVVPVEGSRSNLVGVVVVDGEEAAKAHRATSRRGAA